MAGGTDQNREHRRRNRESRSIESKNRGTVPMTESNGSVGPRPHDAMIPPASGVWSKVARSETTPRQPSTSPNGSAQPRTPNATTPSASGGWSKATRSEMTPRHPSATGVDEGLHGTKTHQRAPPFTTQPPTPAELQQTLEPGNKQEPPLPQLPLPWPPTAKPWSSPEQERDRAPPSP
jgi:hypothetical protein